MLFWNCADLKMNNLQILILIFRIIFTSWCSMQSQYCSVKAQPSAPGTGFMRHVHISPHCIYRLPWWPASQGRALSATWRQGSKMLTLCHWSGSWLYRSMLQETGVWTRPHLRPHTPTVKVHTASTVHVRQGLTLLSGSVHTFNQLEGGLLSISWAYLLYTSFCVILIILCLCCVDPFIIFVLFATYLHSTLETCHNL